VGGGDLLEKFNEISDLILIAPEQLGLKRPIPSSSAEGSPSKRKKLGGSTDGSGQEEEQDKKDLVDQEPDSPKMPIITSVYSLARPQASVVSTPRSIMVTTSSMSQTGEPSSI